MKQSTLNVSVLPMVYLELYKLKKSVLKVSLLAMVYLEPYKSNNRYWRSHFQLRFIWSLTSQTIGIEDLIFSYGLSGALQVKQSVLKVSFSATVYLEPYKSNNRHWRSHFQLRFIWSLTSQTIGIEGLTFSYGLSGALQVKQSVLKVSLSAMVYLEPYKSNNRYWRSHFQLWFIWSLTSQTIGIEGLTFSYGLSGALQVKQSVFNVSMSRMVNLSLNKINWYLNVFLPHMILEPYKSNSGNGTSLFHVWISEILQIKQAGLNVSVSPIVLILYIRRLASKLTCYTTCLFSLLTFIKIIDELFQ